MWASNTAIEGLVNATGGGWSYKDNATGTPPIHDWWNSGGGGYGGIGMNGTFSSEQCPEKTYNWSQLHGNTYGDNTTIAYSGSSGSGQQGGNGGGSIWINVANLFNLSGTIEAKGSNSKSTEGVTYGSGGGSGGSISITLGQVIGTSQALISVQGGNGTYGGGAGGGGILYSAILQSNDSSKFPDSSKGWTGRVVLNNGTMYDGPMDNGTTVNYIADNLLSKESIYYGRSFHQECLQGYEREFCSPWLAGFFKNDTGKEDWVPCDNKPKNRNSKYVWNPGEQKTSNWPYECKSSVPARNKNPQWLNSFNWFIDRIGGWPVVVAIILLIGLSIFVLWLYLRMKAKKREKQRSKYSSFNQMKLNDKRKVLEDDAFTTADLPFQIWRAYFRGTNSPFNQWTIPIEPPFKLRNIVFISSYEDFTSTLNNISKWKKIERLGYYFLMFAFPPALPVFVRYIRKKKFKRLRDQINMTTQTSIWLNSEEHRSDLVNKAIKISASNDYTMGHIDFLDLNNDREFYNGPVLPLTFHLSGDGYFNSPFKINYKDCLVRSLSLLDRTEQFLDIYIENLNSYLESLSFYEFLVFSESKFWKLIRFLHNNNNGILKNRGIKAELAILEYINKGNKTVRFNKSSQIDGITECSQTYIFHFDFIDKFPQTVGNIVDYCRYEMYKGKKDIKLAIIFSRFDQSTLNNTNHNPEVLAVSPKSGFMSIHIQSRYNRSSLRHTKASCPRFADEGEDKNPSSLERSSEESNKNNINALFGGFKNNWDEPLLLKGSNENKEDSAKHSFSATGSVCSEASYVPDRIEVESYDEDEIEAHFNTEENPLVAFKNRRHGRDFCFRFQMFFISFFNLVFLRSVLPPKYPVLNLSLMIILLSIDTACALMVFLLYEHESNFQLTLIPFWFIYPFTILISPLLALTSIVLCRASFYRIFSNLNALTCTTNILFTFIFEFVLLCLSEDSKGQLRSTEAIEPFILLGVKIILKIAIAFFASKQIAFSNNHNFYYNRRVLKSHRIKVENTEDWVTDIFKRNSEDERTTSFAD